MDKDIIIFIDETRVHIFWNVRCFYPRGEKNIREVSSKRISLNAIGALVPNGNSHISFPERTNAFTMILFVLELFKENATNPMVIKELDHILNMANMDSDLVVDEMKMELGFRDEDFTKKVDAINKLNISCEIKKEKLENLLNKFTISNNKLLYRLRSNQMENIINSNLFKKFDNFVIVWDNAKTHIANHVKNILDFLGVRISPVPVRCPDYNPIEYPWSDCKRETAKEPIDDEKELEIFFEKEFYSLTEKNNYSDYWFNLISEKRNKYSDKIEIPSI